MTTIDINDNLNSYEFDLPEELIAKIPLKERSASRLLVLKKAAINPIHKHFSDILDYLNPGDALVLNDTFVIPARIYGKKTTGAKVEILLTKQINTNLWQALVKSNGYLPNGTEILLQEPHTCAIPMHSCVIPAQAGIQEQEPHLKFIATVKEKIAHEPGSYLLEFNTDILDYAEKYGEIPLPPYMQRKGEEKDKNTYQTIYANQNNKGSCAAPTAGLHFDKMLLNKIAEKGVNIAKVTLHVGPGTFLPIKTENINDHKMHKEVFFLSQQTADLLNETKKNGKRIIAVGTTTVRVLESCHTKEDCHTGKGRYLKYDEDPGLRPGDNIFKETSGETDIFIKPGYEFKSIDALITNFHLPKSTLLLLVSALVGREKVLECYKEAIAHHYRFYSYGDACYFEKN